MVTAQDQSIRASGVGDNTTLQTSMVNDAVEVCEEWADPPTTKRELLTPQRPGMSALTRQV